MEPMTAQLSEPPSELKRYSVPLSRQDRADLELIRRSPERLRALPLPVDAESSDASLVRAVFEAGILAVNEVAMEKGYAALAADSEYQEAAQERFRGRSRSRKPANAEDD